MRRKLWTFRVVPALGMTFPTVMLRYDACYPADDESAINLALAVKHLPADAWEDTPLTLQSAQEPTIGRWKSFGWEVKGMEVRQL